MIRYSITEKDRKKLIKNQGNSCNKQQLPDNWVDFANLCKIRSGAKVINFDPYHY